MRKEGDRVGAIIGSNDDGSVDYLGIGTYLGWKKPSEFPEEDRPVGFFGDEITKQDYENAVIKLDDGNIVWGCECWWGGIEAMNKSLEGKKLIQINMREYRKKYKEEQCKEKSS